MVGHRKGKIGPGRYPVKGSRAFIKLIESAMENARHQYEDVDAEEMEITHIAAHRGQIRRDGFLVLVAVQLLEPLPSESRNLP